MKNISGIYKIINKINNKVYIGQSINIKQRLSEHKSKLRGNYHNNYHLQKAWNKYGEDNFTFEIFKICGEDLLDSKEIYWINYYNSINGDYGYNSESGGHKNKHLSELHRQKISKSHKGKKVSDKTKRKISENSKGKKKSEEMKSKLREANLGKKHSEETKQKISKNKKGISFSEEHIEKMLDTRFKDILNGELLSNNTSGVTGVSFDKWSNKWRAYIKLNGKMKYLGRFSNISDAIKVRREAEIKYFSEFSPNKKIA